MFNSFLVQVVGDKEIWLYPHSAIPPEYRSDKFDYGARDAIVNMFDLDLQAFPHLKGVEPRVMYVTAGDVLFIPKGWWHQVRSHTPTVTIAHFMLGTIDRLTTEVWENMRRFLHNQGVYKVKNCTCHAADR